MKNVLMYKILVGVIFVLFIGAGFSPVIGSSFNSEQDVSSLTFYAFGRSGTKKCKVEVDSVVAEDISVMFEDLKNMLTCDPTSDKTNQLKADFVDLLDVNGLIPVGLSKDYVISLLNPSWLKWVNGDSPFNKHGFISSLGSRVYNGFAPGSSSYMGIAFLCSMAGAGSGLLFPPLMIPRPRFVNFWAAYGGGLTTASNLLTGRGFAAVGPQFGITLGFIGVGLTWAIPGEPAYFVFGGYSLYTMVGAAEVENYPLNNEPVVSEEIPSDGEKDVSSTISELSFKISDSDGDRMDYTVTTDPDIGSDSGFNKKNGRYSVSVSGLDPDTSYRWTVSVSDGEDTTEEIFSFNTAVEAPYVSDPNPANGDDWVSTDLSELSFRLEDLQDDPMDYTVETAPDIGSGSGNGVGNGVYSIDVSDLDETTDYTWFVNVTDGKVWTRKVFIFKTTPIMVFDPFDEGWQYRKKITIDHSKVAGDLSDFPVLVNIVDSDLSSKAQVDGDDILFMDGPDVAYRLVHEIERFDSDSGTLAAWVSIPTLSSSSDTEFYMYYGNPGCDNQEYVSRVWDGGFEAVYHMNDFGTQQDSTSNNKDLFPMTAPDYQQTGKIGYCCYFDEDNKEYLQGSSTVTGYPVTIEAWVKLDDVVIPTRCNSVCLPDLSAKHVLGTIAVEPNWKYSTLTRSGGTTLILETTSSYTITNWVYGIARHQSATSHKIMGNNVNEGSSSTSRSPSGIDATVVGCWKHNGGPGDYWMDGWIDEVRISNVYRSDDWCTTTYNSMYYGFDGGFFNVGTEETGP